MLRMIIKGDNGNSLILKDISTKGGDFSAYVSIKSSWYQAKINFSSSHECIKAFIISLEELILRKKFNVNFINENGNFELNILIDVLGKVTLSGCLLNDMLDSSSLTYEFESDLQGLSLFHSQLRLIYT